MMLDPFTDLLGEDERPSETSPSGIRSDNLTVALDLARRGFAVFPVRDWGDGDGRKPIGAFPDRATIDAAQIRAWWKRWPEAVPGLLAGERNGITVLDVDRKNGRDGLATLQAMGLSLDASSMKTRTPSGGWHLFFRYDPRLKNSASKIGDGLDVRTTGGFVIAPGTTRDGSQYTVEGEPLSVGSLPLFPEALIPPPEPEREPVRPAAEVSPEQCARALDYLDRLASNLAATPEGSREVTLNDAVFWAGGAAAHGLVTEEQTRAALAPAAEACGLSAREFESKFKRRAAWDKGQLNPISDIPSAPVDVDNVMDEEADEADALDPTPLRFLSPSECEGAPRRGYVIKGLFAPGDVGCIFGAPGAGKSLIAPYLGYATAQGRAAFTLRTKAGRVLYVAAEDPHGMRGRVHALKLRHGDAHEFTLVEGVSDLLAVGSPDLSALMAAVAERRPALIFVDTLAMAFPGLEENSAEEMGRVVAVARRLASYGSAVVLIHHDTKAQGPTPRGHSLLNGALDVALQLFPKDDSGIVRGKLTKNRNGTCDRDIAFRIAVETLGYDEDGDAETAAIVDEVAPGTAPQREKLSASATAALLVLKQLRGPDSLNVTEDQWRVACVDGRSVSASEDKQSRTRIFRRAFASLVRKGCVIVHEGVVWPAASVTHNTDGNAFDENEG